MGIIGKLIERRSGGFAVSESLPDNHWFFRWLGLRSDAGVIVNEQTALNTLMVVSCVMILADTYASVPLSVYRRLHPRGRERASDHSLYRVLHNEPNPLMSSFTYRHQQMVHLATWGNAYSEIERRRGDVVALWPYHPADVQVSQRDDRSIWYTVREGSTTREIPAANMLHLRGLATRGLVGMTPLAMMRQAIGIAVAAESYGARFFANDARPSILLKHPLSLSAEARKNLRASWQEMHGGENRGGVAVLEEGMDVATLSIPPDDAQFIQTRQFEARQLAGFYRIPPHLISDVDRSTSWGTGIEQQQIGFAVYTMRSWFARTEQEYNRILIPRDEQDRYYSEFNIDGLLRGDSAARKEFYATGRQWGWLSANDVRELENQNPIEHGDIYLQPMNMVPAGYRPPEPDDEPEPPAGQRAERRSRETRSVASRQRLANAHVTLYRDVIARLVRIEQQDVGRGVRQQLREHGVESFRSWLREYYYERFPQQVIRQMQPVVTTLMETIAAEVVDELDADGLPEGRLEEFAQEYVEVYAARHSGNSRSRLLRLINEFTEGRAARQDAELADLIEAELEEWPERVDLEAQDEAHRSGNAASVFVYGLLGVLILRWVVTGSEPCDYCQSLDGRQVNTGSAFLAAGAALAIPGLAPFVSQSSISHPPLHSGCRCVIAAG